MREHLSGGHMTATPSSIVEERHAASELPIRADLTAAHAHVWEKLAAPGTWWNGGERLAIAEIVGAALDDPLPIPPWESPSLSGRFSRNASTEFRAAGCYLSSDRSRWDADGRVVFQDA